jgi:hypothetical protein
VRSPATWWRRRDVSNGSGGGTRRPHGLPMPEGGNRGHGQSSSSRHQ